MMRADWNLILTGLVALTLSRQHFSTALYSPAPSSRRYSALASSNARNH
jgi:hypothetical protein